MSQSQMAIPMVTLEALAATLPGPGKRFGKPFAPIEPVFAMPAGTRLVEIVAVTRRDAKGRPIHGALLGRAEDGRMAQLNLTDPARGIDVGIEPHWIAFGMCMTFGSAVRFNDAGASRDVPWSIVEIPGDNAEAGPGTARAQAIEAYLAHLSPPTD